MGFDYYGILYSYMLPLAIAVIALFWFRSM